jgi:hypothetical protein
VGGQSLDFVLSTNGVTPLAIDFEVQGESCGPGAILTLNGVAQPNVASFPVVNTCSCGGCQSRTGTGNVANFNRSGPNRISFITTSGADVVATVQMCVSFLG